MWFLLAAISLAAAGDPPTPGDVADDVVAAVRAADDEKLRALAAIDGVDPWIVADQLCARGDADVARKYARAAQGAPDTMELGRFVDARAAARAPAAVADALRKAAAAADRAALVEAVRSAGEVTSAYDRAVLASALAQGLRGFGAPVESAQAFVAAADDAERIGWLSSAAESLAAAGLQFALIVDYGNARSLWVRQLEVERRRGRSDRVNDCLHNLAAIDAELGNYGSACARFEEVVAEQLKRGEPARRTAIQTLYNLALTRWRSGEYGKALAACRRAADLLAANGDHDLRASVLILEGDLQFDLGDVTRAESSHRAALDAAKASGDGDLVSLCTATIGNDQRERGEFDASRATYEAALATLTRPDQEPLMAKLLANLSLVHVRRRDYVRAQECGERAVALAEKLGDEHTRANALQSLVQAFRGAGDLAAAGKAADAAVEIAERVDSAQIASIGWAEVAENAMAARDPARAVAASRRAIRAVGEMTSGLAEGQGAQARERYGRLFRVANSAAIELGDPATVFELAENGRAVEFLASLEQGESIRAAAVPPALREAEEAARSAEAAASARHQAARASGELAEIRLRKAALEAAKAKHEEIIDRVRGSARSAAVLFPVAVTEAAARAALGADDALVVYVVGETKCAAVVLTSDAARLVLLGSARDLATVCGGWDTNADAAGAEASIGAIRKFLVDPLKLGSATKRVLVSPDADVYRAPLAAVFAGREVVHVPSASSHVLLAATKKLRGTKVLAVGAPDFTGRGVSVLPQSAAEAKAVGSAPGDVVLTGAAATEQAVRAAIAREPQWRSVHFATHGVIDTKRPMRCGLVLTAASPDDGVLTALEVLQQQVPADLVVLSACDSGGGRVFAGEGLVGMPRAFLFAGSPRVVASSWKVDDAATSALMARFYELWRGQGLRASAALAGAQEAVRSDERWRHPRYWAAWTIWGSGD